MTYREKYYYQKVNHRYNNTLEQSMEYVWMTNHKIALYDFVATLPQLKSFLPYCL